MRKYATGMTAPVRLPFDDADPIWALAELPGWGDDDAIPGYPGTGEDLDHGIDHAVDMRVLDLASRPAPVRSPWLDPMECESGHFLG
jgi:hypothetical protein